jgi:uncharacterized protein (DUF4415 family)
MKARPKLYMPTPEEDAQINAGIEADENTYELSKADFEQLKPIGGRPKKESPKIRVGLRLDADILAAFKATGKGYQTRINNILRDALPELKNKH